MARAFYSHEADDPDLDWLVSNFLADRPDYVPVESGMLPLILMPYNGSANVELEAPEVQKKTTPITEKREAPAAHRSK